jgi:uroporphyrinogen decarboxylase
MTPADPKTARLRAALSHREGDRVPAGEFFWTGFLKRCQALWGQDFDPYHHFDLDYIVINPNMDPRIQPFEVLAADGDDVVVRTGFGATIRRRGELPMPSFEGFSVNRPEEMADFPLDPPDDPRRFRQGGDDQLNCVGDALVRDIDSWEERIKPYVGQLAVFGGVCEPYEYLWRIIGSENALLWLATAPAETAAFVERIGTFLLRHCEAQIEAGGGQLAGMYIWGDVAYRKGMLFGGARWRRMFRPHVKALIDLCHRNGLMVIYHGCGDASSILGDMVEIGLDAYNPLEAKAGLDVVQLKSEYAGSLAFCGNVDVRVLEDGSPGAIREEVLYKLQAARGGGWVFQSDHSITSAVAPESYALAVSTLREYGSYPLVGIASSSRKEAQ